MDKRRAKPSKLPKVQDSKVTKRRSIEPPKVLEQTQSTDSSDGSGGDTRRFQTASSESDQTNYELDYTNIEIPSSSRSAATKQAKQPKVSKIHEAIFFSVNSIFLETA